MIDQRLLKMDESALRSRQKKPSEPSTPEDDHEKEKMFGAKRKTTADNYDFGDAQKVPANVRDIMEKRFSRLFIWELYFGANSKASALRRQSSL